MHYELYLGANPISPFIIINVAKTTFIEYLVQNRFSKILGSKLVSSSLFVKFDLLVTISYLFQNAVREHQHNHYLPGEDP